MRRLAQLASRNPHLSFAAQTDTGVLENPVKLAVQPGRCILTSDTWKRIAQSLHISNRELQIIQGIFDDRKELAIADELTISAHTVHTHLERLYRKLGVSSRVGLILCILSEYISSLPSPF